MTKQRNTLISYVLFYGGFSLSFISILLLLLYTLGLNNYQVDFCHFVLFVLILCGITTPFLASKFNLYFYFSMRNPNYKLIKALRINSDRGFIQGVPNNKMKEYNCISHVCEGVIILEYKDGLYTGDYKGENITINMDGWIFKKKYIYELIQTSLRINYINKGKLPLKYSYITIKDLTIKKLIVVIKSGKKQRKYHIASDGIIKSPMVLRYKNYTKSKFINSNKKISITDFYDLNV